MSCSRSFTNNVVWRNCQLVIGEDEGGKEEAGETRKRDPFQRGKRASIFATDLFQISLKNQIITNEYPQSIAVRKQFYIELFSDIR
jgi:hypothetical protein